MAINFPASSASPWTNPDTGVTYTWDDNRKAWEANAISVPADNKYVEVIGDTMTGPLIVQDNITLTGKVTSAATQAGDIDTICTTKGYVDGLQQGETGRLDGRYVQVAGDTMTGSLTVSNGYLYAEGTNGYLAVNRSGASANNSLISCSSNLGTNVAQITADGGAEFAGNVTTDKSLVAKKTLAVGESSSTAGAITIDTSRNDATSVIRVRSSGTENVSLNADGSADFSAVVRVGKNTAGGDKDGTRILANGGVAASRTSGDVISIYQTGNNDAKATIAADGSAEFAGVITQGSYDSSSANGKGAYIGSGYIIGQQPAAAIGATPIWQGRYGTGDNAVTSEIRANGSASFTGTVTANGTVLTRAGGVTLDVGDSLDKTQAALTALKAAAQDNATDLAGLKAAIVAALANI